MTDIRVDGSRIDFGDTRRGFDVGIKSVEQTSGFVVVLLRVPAGQTNNQNVVCFDRQGKVKWRIEPLPSDRDEKPYMSIDISDGQLFADNWIGVEAAVDLETGEIESTSLSK